MQDITFSQFVLLFAVYSAIGWVCETVWCSVGARKWVSRGFLSGPWCPIYGFGALLILLFAAPAQGNPFLVFLISMLATTVLEYFTGWLLETLFQTRWWDYTNRKCNIKGRVCLRNSLLFGLLALAVVYLVHPAVWRGINILKSTTQRTLAGVIFAALVLDAMRSLAAVTGLRERMEGMRAILAELKAYQDTYTWFDKADPAGSVARLRAICESGDAPAHAADILARIDQMEERRGSGSRMLKSFPNMQPKGFAQEMQVLRQDWNAKRRAKTRRRAKDAKEREKARRREGEVDRRITLTRLVWLFLLGSLIGYLVQSVYCLLANGVIESGQGLLYGPFSQIYGFGAVALVLSLMPFSHRGNGWLFCIGAIVGGLFEVLCGLVQQWWFGMVSLQYAGDPLALLGGRTSLWHIAFLGGLGVAYIRWIYPRIASFTGRMAKRPKRFFTIIIAVGLSFNMLLSALAVGRWADRQRGAAPGNKVEIRLDEEYPDSMMEEIYPNMRPVEEKR